MIFWSGNEICGEHGVEPLPIWGQREPQGDWNAIMDRVKGNIVWWNNQLKELGVDQAALIGEPDPPHLWIESHLYHLCGASEGMVLQRDCQ